MVMRTCREKRVNSATMHDTIDVTQTDLDCLMLFLDWLWVFFIVKPPKGQCSMATAEFHCEGQSEPVQRIQGFGGLRHA